MVKYENLRLIFIVLLLFGIVLTFSDVPFLAAIWARGGDSGVSPLEISMVFEPDSPGNTVTGCSAAGEVSSSTTCDFSCTTMIRGPEYCAPGQQYDDDDCPERTPCKIYRNCVAHNPASVTVSAGGTSAAASVAGGKFIVEGFGEGITSSSFDVTVTANPGGQFSSVRVGCSEGTCQPNWVAGQWGGCGIGSVGEGLRLRWLEDSRCGLEKKKEVESCCNTDLDCGACSKECVSNQCVSDVSLLDPECSDSIWNGFPDCTWDDSDCAIACPVWAQQQPCDDNQTTVYDNEGVTDEMGCFTPAMFHCEESILEDEGEDEDVIVEDEEEDEGEEEDVFEPGLFETGLGDTQVIEGKDTFKIILVGSLVFAFLVYWYWFRRS